MKMLVSGFCCGVLLTGLALAAAPMDFESAQAGSLPKEWSAAKTGAGPGSVWEIREDASAPAGPKTLVQTSAEGPKALFNLCVTDGPRSADVELSVSLKSLAGDIDTGGGLLWRYQDENNYYVARLNPNEENFRLYKVVNGIRKQLATAESDAAEGKWHTMRIVHRGGAIQCHLNGKLLLEATDTEISKPGKIGLWTKADAVTAFDALSVAPAK